MAWHDIIGLLGVSLILLSYALLQLERLDSRSRAYNAGNALGAGLVLVSLLFEFNLSAFVIETAWLVISLYGLHRHRRHSATGN